jgi:hypothetical protein
MLIDMWLHLGDDGNIRELDHGDHCTLHEYVRTDRIVHLKLMSFIIC